MNTKRPLHLLWALLALLALASCGGSDDPSNDGGDPSDGGASVTRNDNKNPVTTETAVSRLEFPRLKGGSSIVIVHRTADKARFDPDDVNYSTEWDCDKKSQRWSCYILTATNKRHNVSRYYGDPQYPNDPALTADEQWEKDYFYSSSYGSGARDDISFDHGHICPSNDRLYSSEANYQTFFLTNMQPQYKVFNGSHPSHKYKGLWIKMEDFVNKLGLAPSDTLYVCKGGTIDSEDQILTRIQGKLIVPKYFFAAILMKNSLGYRAIGFWFEHTNVYHGDDSLTQYAVSIDELEKKTGIDFFCNLPDDIETRVESSYATLPWGL